MDTKTFPIGYLLIGTLAAVMLCGQSPDSGRIYMNFAATCLSTGDYEEAVAQYQNVLRFRPGHAAATYNIACAHSLNNQPDQALAWLAKAVDLGLYSFDGDSDLDNIRSTKPYQKLKIKADKLLAQMKSQIFEPVILTPAKTDSGRTYPLVIALHGWGGNPVDFSANLKSVVDRRGYIVCCPYGPDVMGKTTFGWGDDTTAERVVIETLAKMTAKYPVDQARVVLLGFSQGGGYSFYLGLKHADLFLGVMPVAAAYYDTSWNQYLADVRSSGTRFYILLGGEESSERRQINLDALNTLADNGITVSLNVFAGYGHTLPGDFEFELERALDWLEHYQKR